MTKSAQTTIRSEELNSDRVLTLVKASSGHFLIMSVSVSGEGQQNALVGKYDALNDAASDFDLILARLKPTALRVV